MSDILWIAIGLFLVLEGIAPMIIPHTWKRYLHLISVTPANQLRRVGGVMVVIGSVILFYKIGG